MHNILSKVNMQPLHTINTFKGARETQGIKIEQVMLLPRQAEKPCSPVHI